MVVATDIGINATSYSTLRTALHGVDDRWTAGSTAGGRTEAGKGPASGRSLAKRTGGDGRRNGRGHGAGGKAREAHAHVKAQKRKRAKGAAHPRT